MNYNTFKALFYISCGGFTIFSILKYGLVSSHTPPLGFVIPVFTLFLGLVWGLIDWVILMFLPNVKINFEYHYYGIALNLLISIYTL